MTSPGLTDPLPDSPVPAGPVPAGPVPAGPVPAGTVPAGTGPGGTVPANQVPGDTVPASPFPPGAGSDLTPDTGWLRLSPRSMVVRPLTDLVRLVPLLAGLLILHSSTGGGLIWGVLAAAAAIMTGLVHWATTRYRITSERVYLRRGLLSKKVLSVARDRIRTVDVTAHLLHRALGVCRVSIGTGRNDYRPGESFHLDGLTRSDAESLRVVLLTTATTAAAASLAQVGVTGPAIEVPGPADQPGQPGQAAERGQAQASGQASVGEEARQIANLNLSWLRFAPLTMTGLVVLGVLFGALIQFSNATEVNLVATGPVQALVRHFAALNIAERILVGGVVAMAGYMLVALVGYVAVYWNFKLAGYGADTLRVTRGLLSLRATTISRSRLRGVEISEPLLLRAARGARCIAITTGLQVGRGAEHEGAVLLPPAPREVAQRVTAEILGVPAQLCTGPLRRHGPAALRRRLFRAIASAVAIIACIWAATWARNGPAWVWAGSLVLLPCAVLVAVDRYRNLGHLLADGWLVTRTGSFARRRCIIGTGAIIGWRIHQTFFQRRQGLMTLTATTAAGQQHYSLRDVPADLGLAVALAATGDLIEPFLIEPFLSV
ncbi:MAG TPA: PH domain-containing protein [Streptosporangiaceae bacterium]|nr:PH domain-containing protein [Streptosporangiaceae bacterium]